MDELDRRILQATQDGLPLCAQPYDQVAAEIGISTEELLARLHAMRERGEVRRVGASVAHRIAGFRSNVLCVWRVPPEEMDAFAAEAVQRPEVSHCYERPALPDWPYNLYVMIHGRTEEETDRVIRELCDHTGQGGYVALVSTREFKKTWTRL